MVDSVENISCTQLYAGSGFRTAARILKGCLLRCCCWWWW